MEKENKRERGTFKFAIKKKMQCKKTMSKSLQRAEGVAVIRLNTFCTE